MYSGYILTIIIKKADVVINLREWGYIWGVWSGRRRLGNNVNTVLNSFAEYFKIKREKIKAKFNVFIM